MLAALVLVGVAGVAVAAHERAAKVRHVALVLVDSLNRPGLRAEILRSTDPARRDLILLPREATADTLATALASYRECAVVPARAGQVTRIAVTDQMRRTPPDPKLRARAVRLLAKVRCARPSQIGRFGRGRWTIVRIPVDP